MRQQSNRLGLIMLMMAGLGFSAEAVLIKPSVKAYSTQLGSRDAVNSCNGSGLTGIGNQGDPHNTSENGVVWTTIGTNTVAGSADFDPYITYDLGGVYNVNLIREWGYNNVHPFGPSNVVVYTSKDGIIFTNAGAVIFAKAPNTATYGGNEIAVNYPGAQFRVVCNFQDWLIKATRLFTPVAQL